MRRAIVLAIPSFPLLARAAQAAERGGFDRIWTTEIPGRDAFVRAMHVAHATSTIQVGTGIAYASTRHPMAVAGAAHEANLATDGRITVGLGTAAADVRASIGLEWDHPAPRLAEYIALVKQALQTTGGLDFHGRFYDVALPGLSLGTGQSLTPAVFGSGANPAALRAISRTADGILLHPLAVQTTYLDDVVLPAIRSGGNERPLELVAWCVAAIDDDVEVARTRARTRLALYIANRNFVAVLAHTGWGSVGEAVRAEAERTRSTPDWAALGALIPDGLLDELAVCGPPAAVQARIAQLDTALSERGISELALQLTGVGSPEAQLAEIDVLAGATPIPVAVGDHQTR